jgi:leader peptidase (prepilin peptidase)/N-methyltransferase
MNPLLITLLTLAGIAVGWGLRAVIVRYAIPAGEVARQCCPGCESQTLVARWRPWLLPTPSGRCARCGERTGPPALVVEAITAILFGALAARIHPGLVLAAACWLAACAVPLAFIDVAVRRLPDLLTAPAYAGTLVLLLLAAGVGGHWHTLVQAVLGGIALTGFYLILVIISPGGMGLGDVKAAASLGTLLAWLGWGALLFGAVAGFLLAALYGVALLVSCRATRKQQIPFGPFMIIGAFAVILAWHV